MSSIFRAGVGLVVALSGLTAAAQTKTLVAPNQSPTARAVQAEVVIVGKVTEIEKDAVEGPAYAGAPKDQRATYKVAVVKIEDRLIGAKGLTLVRVGFSTDAPAVAPPPGLVGAPPAVAGRVPRLRPGSATVALTTGLEGCFMLERLPGADFYVLSGNGPPLDKKDENYTKQLEPVRKVARAIEDPVSALKTKDRDERFLAAHALLRRYQRASPGDMLGVPIPAEENQQILDLLLELPWLPQPGADSKVPGEPPPSRAALWSFIRSNEHGFRAPKAVAGENFDQRMDEATAEFLKANKDRIKIKKYEK
jgi:hypothetical protein